MKDLIQQNFLMFRLHGLLGALKPIMGTLINQQKGFLIRVLKLLGPGGPC